MNLETWSATVEVKLREIVSEEILLVNILHISALKYLHYDVLVQFQFATSKANLDISYNKLGIQIVSRVAERLKT